MDPHSPQFQYVEGQMRTHFGALLDAFEQRNRRALERPGWTLDLPYGPHVRETMDLLSAGAGARGTVVYFHAGYWQSRDKSQFRFLAPLLQSMGWHTALVNYPLCPQVTVAQIVASASRALAHAADQLQGPLVLCGHSAGAHLAIELALEQAARPASVPLAGVVAISGVYDLQPLIETSLNTRLQLDAVLARASSPTQRVCRGAAPACFVWGETETPAFHAQSRQMAQLWQAHGNAAQCAAITGADHFSVLDRVMEENGLVARTLHHWASA